MFNAAVVIRPRQRGTKAGALMTCEGVGPNAHRCPTPPRARCGEHCASGAPRSPERVRPLLLLVVYYYNAQRGTLHYVCGWRAARLRAASVPDRGKDPLPTLTDLRRPAFASACGFLLVKSRRSCLMAAESAAVGAPLHLSEDIASLNQYYCKIS